MNKTNVFRRLGAIAVSLLLFSGMLISSITVAAADTPGAGDGFYSISQGYRTGVKLPTEEEQERIDASAEVAVKIVPNEMGIARINGANAKGSGISLSAAAPDDGILTKDDINESSPKSTFYTQSLPLTADNSKLKYFPNIGNQGSLGSCAAFATSYYLMTYETARARDWDASTGNTNYTFSPKWSYNLLNGGADNGCWPGDIANFMGTYGAATWAEIPYDINFREWPNTAEKWESALKYRSDGYGYIKDLNTPEGILNLKNALNNGMVLVMVTPSITGWMGSSIKDNPDSTLDDSELGQWACCYMVNAGGRHALTIVGYNDDLWIDRDNDNVQDAGELGAFKVANSWGSAWGKDGFVWFSYAAINDTTESTGHSGIVLENNALYLKVSSTDYEPLVTAQMKMTTANRGGLEYYYGLNWPQTSLPDPATRFDWDGGYFDFTNFIGWPFFKYGGQYSFAGTTNAQQGIIVFDMSNVARGISGGHNWNSEGGPLSFCIGIKDAKDDNLPITVDDIVFKNWSTGQSVSAQGIGQTYDDDYLWFSATDFLNPENAVPSDDPSIGNLPEITENNTVCLPQTANGSGAWKFTPAESGTYIFKTDSQSIYTEMQNSAGKVLFTGCGMRDDISFIRANLLSGNTYKLKVSPLYRFSASPVNICVYKIDPQSNADISDIMAKDPDFSPVPLTPAFDKSTGNYIVKVPKIETSIRLYPITESERAKIYIDGIRNSTALVPLKMGESQNVIIQTVSSDGNNTKEYNVQIVYPYYYTVTFDLQDGSSVTSRIAELNTMITPPATPQKTGYKFGGWYKEAACTNVWDFLVDTVKADTKLFAKWSVETYAIIFDSRNDSAYIKISADYNTKITPPAIPEKTGYEFGGWYKNFTCTNVWDFSVNTVKADMYLFAKWNAKTYTITFDSQYGSAVGSKTAKYDAKITPPAAPKKTGYEFGGWYKEAACTNEWVFSNDTVNSDTKLFAKWDANTYTITFDSQYGSAVGSKTADYDAKIAPPAAPKKPGYKFEGWYKEATCTNVWDFSTDTVDGDLTLFAKWSISQLSMPTGLKAVSTAYDSIRISWNKDSLATKYTIYRSPSANGTYSKLKEVTANSYTDTGLKTNTAYYYKITANNSTGTSALSVCCGAKPVLGVPAGVRIAKTSSTSVKLSWGKVNGASGYEVYRGKQATAITKYVKSTKNLYFKNTGLSRNQTYYYKIRTYRWVDGKKVYSSYSAIVKIKL
jgi:uncharacterized repeat protein (TIGR02543 family)